MFPHSVPLEAFILKNRGRGKDFFICAEASGTGSRAETIDKGRRFSSFISKIVRRRLFLLQHFKNEDNIFQKEPFLRSKYNVG